MRFAKGYKQDSMDYGYQKHHGLISTAPPMLSEPNHRPFRKGWIWQSDIGMCTGMALKRCCQLWANMAGIEEQLMISGLFAYSAGRAQEDAGKDPDGLSNLVDEGAQPGLVLRAVNQVGLVLASDYPDPDTDGFNPAYTNIRPGGDIAEAAYDGKGVTGYEVAPTKEAIRAVMLRRVPIQFAMFVDTNFEFNVGEIITSINESDPDGGGHMMALLNASSDQYVEFDNSWQNLAQGITWGAVDGTGRMSWDCFLGHVQQLLAITSVPLIKKAV